MNSGNYNGLPRPELNELPQIQSRLTFVYLERCRISRDEGAVTVTTDAGIVYIPAASINVFMLGPGTEVTHRAMELLGDCGVSVVWVGEHGVRYYAGGDPMTHSSKLLLKQAAMVSNERQHLRVARKMYEMRFPDEDVTKLTMQQLRGKEGARVRRTYRKYAEMYNVQWNGRCFDPDDYQSGDAVNKALSAGTACLYGLAHAVIIALGCSPGLGFVHVGHERSFVYDVADLYKAEFVIPLAFELAAENPDDIGSLMRRRLRDSMVEKHLLERMVKDIQILLIEDSDIDSTVDAVYLWDNRGEPVEGGTLYGAEGERVETWEDHS